MKFFLFIKILIIFFLIIFFFTNCISELTNIETINELINPQNSPTITPIIQLTPLPTTTNTTALIKNDTFWKDTSNDPIFSQGGGVFKFGDTYYWYGVKYQGAVSYYNNPVSKFDKEVIFQAITCYSSQDLINWKFENNVFTTTSPGLEFSTDTWVGRMGVVYHAGNNNYVLISQYSGTSGTGIFFATSNTPNGNFVFNNLVTSLPITNTMTGDQTLFQDDDGKAYLICSSRWGRAFLYVIPLRASDFLACDPPVLVFYGAGREGNCMFKYKGKYFFCSSELYGWNSSHAFYIYADKITGPYSATTPPDKVMSGTDEDFSHVSQTGFFITVNGSEKSTVIFCGDRWSDFAGNGIGYNQWCPVSFDEATGTIPQFNSVGEWTIDAETGNWAVGKGNNYVLNASFEADRVSIQKPAGWSTTTNLSGATPHSNKTKGHTGNWHWQMTYSTNYEGKIYQVVRALPNVEYTLSVWVKSSGGQTSCELYAKDYNGTDELVYNFNTSISSWTKVSIPNINVTNSQCEIGIRTVANANNWCQVDDFTLTAN